MLIGQHKYIRFDTVGPFFLVYVRIQIYKNKRHLIPELTNEIHCILSETRPKLSQNVIEHLKKKVVACEVIHK